MKILLIVFLTSVSSFCLAQQNLFNIPSGQLTPKNKWFYQHQLNTYDSQNISSKQHLAFGATHNFEVGFNFLNWNFLKSPMSRNPKTIKQSPGAQIPALTLQTQFRLTSELSINVGTQSGITGLGQNSPSYFAYKHYGLLTFFHEATHARLTAGPWTANRKFNGQGNTTGFMAGGEWMFKDGLYIMGDWISGSTKNSVSVLGGMIDVGPGVQLCLGYLLPNPKSSEGEGIVFEVNLFEI